MNSECQTRQERIDHQPGRAGWAVGGSQVSEEFLVAPIDRLGVLAARGLIIPVSREAQAGDTGAFVFGNAYRLPLEESENVLSTETGDAILTEAGEEIVANEVAGDSSRLREMDRLAALVKEERTLE